MANELEVAAKDAFWRDGVMACAQRHRATIEIAGRDSKASFTLETVISSPDKVQLLEQAQQLGYRTYLDFIATDDPAINVSRVQNRVKQGGHPVPEDKIVNRYHRSLELLLDAIRHANRASILDNSGYTLTTLVTIKTANARRKSPMDTPWRSKPILFPRGFRMLFSKKSRPRCRKNKGDNGIGVSPVFWRVNNGPMHQGVKRSRPKLEGVVRNATVIFDSTSREKRTSG